MKVRKMSDEDIMKFSVGEISSFNTISKSECIRAENGIYDLTIFGTLDFCHCGDLLEEGDCCVRCGVKKIPKEAAINSGAYFKMPAAFITDISLRELSSILREEYDIKIPSSIEGLWGYAYRDHIGTFALDYLSRTQGLGFIQNYVNRLFYIVHPSFRPICIVDKNKYIPDNYSLGVSLFLQSCILGEKHVENLRDLNLLYNEIMKSSDGFKAGKNNGLRKFLRYNFVKECVSGVIVPDPSMEVTSIGVPYFLLKNIPESKREWAFVIRYPVLHSYNLMVFRVIPIHSSDKCIRIHPLTVQPFGGDFDGDTMQVVFLDRSDSDFMVNERDLKEKDKTPLFSFKGEYENLYCDSNKSLRDNFENCSYRLTVEGLPPFSFSGDNEALASAVPKLRGKSLNSLFNPMYSLSTSLVNGLSYQDFLRLSVINRDILSIKQDLVAISGYNTRQLVLAMWEKNPIYATSFTEGMTQRALSLKHGGDSSIKSRPINKERVTSVSGRIAKNDNECFFLSDKYTIRDGWIVEKEETPIYAAIFPVMKMLGFKLGSTNARYIKRFKDIKLVRNYAESSGVLRIGRDNVYFIGDNEYYNENEECFIVQEGSIVSEGQKILTGITDLSFYCDIFSIDLMRDIFIKEITFHAGINFSNSVLENIFDVLYNFRMSVTCAIDNNKDFLFQWYAKSLKFALSGDRYIRDLNIKKLFGL